MIAISVNLTDPDRVAGNIQNGSEVAIFVTGELTALPAGAGGAAADAAQSTQSTRLLLPKVTVLNVGSPQPPTTSTKTADDGTQTTEQLPAHPADPRRDPEGGAEGDRGVQGPRPDLRAADLQQPGQARTRYLDPRRVTLQVS